MRGRRNRGAGTRGGMQIEDIFGGQLEFSRHLIARGGGGG